MIVTPEMGQAVHAAAPYAVMTLKLVSNAGMMAMLRSTLDPAHGVNSVVLTAYQQLASASVLVSLALLLDRYLSFVCSYFHDCDCAYTFSIVYISPLQNSKLWNENGRVKGLRYILFFNN
jgi:hypothetical protein